MTTPPVTTRPDDADTTAASDPAEPSPPRRAPGSVVAVGVVAVAVVAAAAIVVVGRRGSDDEGGWRRADVGEQGTPDSVYESGGARLQRGTDRLAVEVVVPTPGPGSYEYPTHDMIPPWIDWHPPVSPGAGDAPEIFTLWLIAFNDPTQCTDGLCDADDLADDAAARGGVYQVDGRLGDGAELHFTGNVRLGEDQLSGSPLDDPLGAEVHVAIAPHGRALSGADRARQLNSPVGTPALWWGARFPAE